MSAESWQSLRFVHATTQLGFRSDSPKTVTLIPQDDAARQAADVLPFAVQRVMNRLERRLNVPEIWGPAPWPWPFDPLNGPPLQPWRNYGSAAQASGGIAFLGELRRTESRWGSCWQGRFDAFRTEGIYQIETAHGMTPPFVIDRDPYTKLVRGYLNYLNAQRCGVDLPGVRRAMDTEDAVRDSDGVWLPVGGGWYNAGDRRKWLSLTLQNLEACTRIANIGHPDFRATALDELRWGNRYFHNMVTAEGQVYEDVGGGDLREGFNYEQHWWIENHPGCIAGHFTQRTIRTTYNPWVQFLFARAQAGTAAVLSAAEGDRCRSLAARAWHYGLRRRHDDRTLFLAGELRAALELRAAGCDISEVEIDALADRLLARQDLGEPGLSGYFLEKDGADAYRSIAFACDPAFALLRLCELRHAGDARAGAARTAIEHFIDRFLLADARSNPFGVTPYGVFFQPPLAEHQTFRDAGRGRGVRTFIHPFNEQRMVHGTNGALMHHAALLARAGRTFERDDWLAAAERLLQWSTGHNPAGLSLFTGAGFHHPVPMSAFAHQIPGAALNGFCGRPDDTPYVETANLEEWNTQEVWDVPNYYATEAALHLGGDSRGC